jgi:hypothetical protein
MRATAVREGIGIAVEAIRSNRVRIFLTVLGVTIGTATAMLVAAIIVGVQTAVFDLVQSSSTGGLSVWRFDPDQIQLMRMWRRYVGEVVFEPPTIPGRFTDAYGRCSHMCVARRL